MAVAAVVVPRPTCPELTVGVDPVRVTVVGTIPALKVCAAENV